MTTKPKYLCIGGPWDGKRIECEGSELIMHYSVPAKKYRFRNPPPDVISETVKECKYRKEHIQCTENFGTPDERYETFTMLVDCRLTPMEAISTLANFYSRDAK